MAYKHDYDKILTRLVTILSKLNDGEALSVKELAIEFNTSVRTVQRDFNERLMSFPIYQENKKWKMQDGYRLEKSKSIEDEIILDIIEKITESIGGAFASKSNKLLSKIKNDQFNPIYAKLNIEDITDKVKEIQILETAIKENREVRFVYENGKRNEKISRPLKIVNFEGFWYLLAQDNAIVKKYYLKNISDVKLTDNFFEVSKTLENTLKNSISIWFDENAEPFEVKILANAIAAKYFKRRPLPTQSIESIYADDSFEFTVKVTNEMEIMPIIKYWLPHLEILEPQCMRDTLKEELRAYISNLDN